MALEGTLRDFSLADIFQLIGLQRKTGVLTLRSPEDVVTISFLDGKVVGADSLNKRLEDRLGQVLLKTGLVSQAKLDATLKTQMETLERLGHILIRTGVLSRDELRLALEQQILQIIFRTFRWQNGDYQFSQETRIDYDAELVTPLGAESILMEGARMLDEWPIIEKRIPHRGIIFRVTPSARQVEVADGEQMEDLDAFEFESEPTPAQPVPTGGRLRVSPLEFDVLELVDGVSSVEDIVRKTIHGEFDTCKALYNLLTRGLIREATRDELARTLPPDEATAAIKVPRGLRIPWFGLLLVPLLAGSMFIAFRNPLNPIFGPGPKLVPYLQSSSSWARMWGLWQALQARSMLVGSYPESLADLVRDALMADDDIHDPWGRPYRYLLREQSVLIAGTTKHGAPDPNLIISVHLGTEIMDKTPGAGATLILP